MRFYRVAVFLLRYIVLALFRIKIIGKDTVPKGKPLIVCANHISLWDPVFVAACCRQPIHFMAKSELFEKPVLKWLLKALGAYPIKRGESDVAAIKKTLTYLRGTDRVGIFLQGTRNAGQDLESTDVKSGVGMILGHTEVDTLPVTVVTKDNRVKLFRKVYVVIGKPVPYEQIKAQSKSKEAYKQVSERVFEIICNNAKEVTKQ